MTFSATYPLTVMFIIDVLIKMGGAERSLYLLVRGLEARGHKVIICCLRGGELSNSMRNEGFCVKELNLTKALSFKGLISLYKLIRMARKEKASAIVSYHNTSDYLGLLVSILAKVPIVSSRRDIGFQLKSRHIWLYRLINRFFDHIAAVSSGVKEAVVKNQWSRPSDITVIHNGIDSFSNSDKPVVGSALRLNGLEFDDGCVNICCLAHIHPIKGQKDLIDAADLVVREFPNARFFLVGNRQHHPAYYADIRRQVKDLGLEKVVKFTGEVSPANTTDLLATMDISVSSSLSEGMSNALLEAMSVGNPVVATAVGGNPELVEHGRTGFLVPPRNPQSMAEALCKLLSNPELRHEMGLRGRSRMETEFSVTRMVERYEDLLQYVYLRRRPENRHSLRSKVTKTTQRIRSWAKIFIASIIYYSGLIVALRWVKRALHLGRVKILCFHDVSHLAETRPHFSVFIQPESFIRFLDFLAQNYQVVSLEEATRLLQDGQPLTDDVFALTFDDCYKGWIDHVLPECQRLQVPYAIFLATEPMDSGRPLLYDALILLAENTWRKVVDLSAWGLSVFLLDNQENIFHFVEEVHEYWRGSFRENRYRFLQDLSEYLGVSLNSEKFENIIVDWHDIRKMDMHGITIGAHTVSHTLLRDLLEPEYYWEVFQSKKRLEEELGHAIDFFAYPYGAPDYYNSNNMKIVKEVGFKSAFTLDVVKSNEFHPFEIGRHSVSRGMFIDQNDSFSEPLLATELCGLGDILFGRVFAKTKPRGTGTYVPKRR